MRGRELSTLLCLAALSSASVMCGNPDGIRQRVERPLDGEGGDTSGMMPGTAGNVFGSSGGSGGTLSANGESGANGSPGDAGSAGTPSTQDAAGGSGENPASAAAAGVASDAGTSSASGGTLASGTGGSSPSAGTGGSAGATGGSPGTGGAAGGCGTPSSCCEPGDPPCSESTPCTDFCCDATNGARIACDGSGEPEVCINPCTNTSYGTGSCDSCTNVDDPPCSDPSWTAPCAAGGEATCSDPVVGYSLGCFSSAPGVISTFLACTCSGAGPCTPTPCCDATSPVCETDRCDPENAGYCCSPTGNYAEICRDHGTYQSFDQQICINDCTGRSYGTDSCADCLSATDPVCDPTYDWMTGCGDAPGLIYCSDPLRGFRLSCGEAAPGASEASILIVCSCAPD
jgi:hypothetical protein